MFWTSGDVCPGFQSRIGFYCFHAPFPARNGFLVRHLPTYWHLAWQSGQKGRKAVFIMSVKESGAKKFNSIIKRAFPPAFLLSMKLPVMSSYFFTLQKITHLNLEHSFRIHLLRRFGSAKPGHDTKQQRLGYWLA